MPGVNIGPGPLPPAALYAQRDPVIESTSKHYYWDGQGRRHARPAGMDDDEDEHDTGYIVRQVGIV